MTHADLTSLADHKWNDIVVDGRGNPYVNNIGFDCAPDGICLDAENAIWYGDVPNKRCVRVREGGEVLHTIHLDRGCFACTLGGADRRGLFLTANEWRGTANMADESRMGQVLIAEAPAPGAGWP